jgi:hypothetical protein
MIKILKRLSITQKKQLEEGVICVSAKAMNRTALGIVDAVIQLYPNCSIEELKEILPDDSNPAAPKNYKSLFKPYTDRKYGVIQPDSIIKECEAQGLDVAASHFTGEGESFILKDGMKVLVSRSWESKDTETGEHDLQNLINHVKKYGVIVLENDESKNIGEKGYKTKIINQEIFEIISNPKEKNIYIWIIAIALILFAFAIYFFLKK